MKKLAAFAALATAALPAQATVVTLNFSGVIPEWNSVFASGSDMYLSDFQRDYIGGFQRTSGSTPGTAYNFTFSYDTDATAVGGQYPVTFSQMQIDGAPSNLFDDFTPSITFQTAGTYKYMMVSLAKTETFGPNNYTSYAFFELGDNDGDIVNGVLPNVTDTGVYDFVIASFEVYGRNGTYRNIVDSQSRGLGIVPPGDGSPPAGAVPEPATWALMIGGFALAGGALRRRTLRPVFA